VEPATYEGLRADLRRLLEIVHCFRQRYVILRNGNAMVILLPMEDFQQWLTRLRR